MIDLNFVRGQDCFDECRVHSANAAQLRQIISARAATFTKAQRRGPFTVKVFIMGELWSEWGPFVVRQYGGIPSCRQWRFIKRSRKRRLAR
jgi:hypothetical protein